MTTDKLQSEINSIINKLGWSKNRLAREVYVATFDDDNEVEIKRLEERLKKELSRSSTKPERLEEYLQIISRNREFEKLDLVLPVFIKNKYLSDNVMSGMATISKTIAMGLDRDSEL